MTEQEQTEKISGNESSASANYDDKMNVVLLNEENDVEDDDTEETEDGEEEQGKRKSPLKAIRLKCLDCSGGSWNEVSQCWAEDCPLHPFRFGKNPFRVKRVMSDEQKEAARERLRLARENRKESGNQSQEED